ncbi:AtpZ/AtpI family protein [Marinisporobacter balticus]|uniref:Putative F0F1-ATPase subunit (Ca2+/Mg2+ transporter) n=1 Tax=Marinisporobacter balticus TaxID=2018667 RepID=A0A4R2KXW7_9FIRM|nr:AtpZ/AtpI family protein [Marinisporobacter balticus]TCO78793.1 putative F0F1-ATPase subunit (Ca2+/Mg2+ transporter) [Marinisporobacter balticus]
MTKNNLNIFKNLSLLSYIGIMMIVPIFGAVYLGNLLDQKLGTNHVFMIICILLGVGAGFRNVYTIMIKSMKKKK